MSFIQTLWVLDANFILNAFWHIYENIIKTWIVEIKSPEGNDNAKVYLQVKNETNILADVLMDVDKTTGEKNKTDELKVAIFVNSTPTSSEIETIKKKLDTEGYENIKIEVVYNGKPMRSDHDRLSLREHYMDSEIGRLCNVIELSPHLSDIRATLQLTN